VHQVAHAAVALAVELLDQLRTHQRPRLLPEVVAAEDDVHTGTEDGFEVAEVEVGVEGDHALHEIGFLVDELGELDEAHRLPAVLEDAQRGVADGRTALVSSTIKTGVQRRANACGFVSWRLRPSVSVPSAPELARHLADVLEVAGVPYAITRR
jgi:hypothetical protein